MAQPSPYTPGEVARDLPGRAAQLQEMDERLALVADLSRLAGRIRVDHAARGLGKTSLLRRAQRLAQDRGLFTVWVTGGDGQSLVADIADQINRGTVSWKSATRRTIRQALSHLSVTLGVPGVAQVTAAGTETVQHGTEAPMPLAATPARRFEDLLRHTVTVAGKEGLHGVVLFIDEVQAADAEGLRTLAYAWQHLQSEGLDVPAAVFTAGLPTAAEVIGAAVSFSERFAYRPLGPLDDGAVAQALADPARLRGVTWESGALAEAVAIADGYPCAVQLIGDAVWQAAGRPDVGGVLTGAHVAAGREQTRRDLEGLYRSRWGQATRAEREFMTAMAAVGSEPVARADIAARLGTATTALGPVRRRLLDRDFVEITGHGYLAFTLPGFAAWVRTGAA